MKEEFEKAFRQGFVFVRMEKGGETEVRRFSLSEACLRFDKQKGCFYIFRKQYPMFFYAENYGRKRTALGHVWALEKRELEQQ